VVLLVGGVVALRSRGPAPPRRPSYWPTQGWRTATPEAQGFRSDKLAAALLTLREQDVHVHSLLAIRSGNVFVDATFYPYDGTTLHDVASVTKSVMTTLIGIAADQGKIRLDQSMVSFFEGRAIANRDARKDRITVSHLVTMSSGLDCTPERDEATLKEMWTAEDWIQFTLDRPVVREPGTQFVYCSPGSHLLSAILQRSTGMTALAFARQYLFAPLGITDVIWPADPQGVTRGWGDIRLRPHDMAKIGFLWRNRGVWEGRRIVSAAWVTDSVKPLISTHDDGHYGYGWWVATADAPGEYSSYRADGRGGQYVIVVPSLDLIIVTTGGGFDFDVVAPLLVQAIGDMRRPLPANPDGVAALQAAVRAVAQAPPSTAVAPLPATARAISGKTYVFAPNPLGLVSARLAFDGSSTAVMSLAFNGDAQLHTWPVGLDGVYRMSRGTYDAPQGVRGRWVDDRTFEFEYAGITNNDHWVHRMRFEGTRVTMRGQETAHDLGVTLEGRLQQP
jgi:CubicO group peptidase (beta-lactamase class C family)